MNFALTRVFPSQSVFVSQAYIFLYASLIAELKQMSILGNSSYRFHIPLVLVLIYHSLEFIRQKYFNYSFIFELLKKLSVKTSSLT